MSLACTATDPPPFFFFFLLLWFSLELVYMLDAACYVKCGVVQQKCESEYLSEGAFMKDVLQKS